MTTSAPDIGRAARKRQRNERALIAAARGVMAEKGIDAATIHEIAERADIGAGTVYYYFKSKDDLAIAVLEGLMHDLAVRIEKVTRQFEDPAQVYAFGVRTVIDTATMDVRWRQLLYRSEVMSDAMCRKMGPFAQRDLERATASGRFNVADAEITFRMAAHAIVGSALAIANGPLAPDAVLEVTIGVLCMTGITRAEAEELARRDRPALPQDDWEAA